MAKRDIKQNAAKIGIFALVVLGGILFFFGVILQPKAQSEDYRKLASSKFDTAFLAMYPIDTYEAEDFLTYRGMTVFKASYCIPNFNVVKQYMKQIAASENEISTIYLGIRPDKTNFRELRALCAIYPSVDFEIILSYPSAGYWRGLSAAKYEKVLESYLDFLTEASQIPNANFYCVSSQKWLLANPDNYRDEWAVTETTAKTIMLHSDNQHEYLVTAETSVYFSKQLQNVTQEIRMNNSDFQDLSNHFVVFFGDSVIGNYTDSNSIPGVVAGLTKAKVYNCGYGGNTAAMNPDKIVALAGIAEAFAKGNLSELPCDIQPYQGISSYLDELSDTVSYQPLSVVINYGLNDYFEGAPICSEENPYDITTFCGAVRTAVFDIRTSYPDAQIILCTPSYCALFEFGAEPHGTMGNVLNDYVEAILALAKELDTCVLDTYHGFKISRDNWEEYLLQDQVHPNEAYRYLIGEELSRLIY